MFLQTKRFRISSRCCSLHKLKTPQPPHAAKLWLGEKGSNNQINSKSLRLNWICWEFEWNEKVQDKIWEDICELENQAIILDAKNPLWKYFKIRRRIPTDGKEWWMEKVWYLKARLPCPPGFPSQRSRKIKENKDQKQQKIFAFYKDFLGKVMFVFEEKLFAVCAVCCSDSF